MTNVLSFIIIVLLFHFTIETDGKMDLYTTDQDTGCQYMMSWYGMPGPIRLDEEGKPKGCSNLENWQNREVKQHER